MQLRAGQLFAERYRLQKPLGRGGFATVYLATDENGDRVAVKVLRPDDGADYRFATRKRFVREASALRNLRAPNTVRLLDAGEAASGELYLAFEYLEGEDLGQLFARGEKLRAPQVRHIFDQVLSSLAEAHRHGVVHRDIKPANILLCPTPADRYAVKLLDFGIARPLDPGATVITQQGELIGTFRYMAPEQLRGLPVTPAADIYSLGLVGIEALLGSEALAANTLGAQITRTCSGHLFALPDGVDPRLVAVIQRMTQTSVEGRYATAAMARRALRPEPARTDHVRTSPRWVPVGVAVLLIIIALAFALWPDEARRARLPRPERPSNPLGAHQEIQPAADVGRAEVEPQLIDWPTASLEDHTKPTRSGCGLPAGPLVHLTNTITTLPEPYDPNRRYPVVVVLPAVTHGALKFAETSGLRERMRATNDFILITLRSPGNLSWSGSKAEVDYAEGLVRVVRETLCVDPDRIDVVADLDGGFTLRALECRPWVHAVGYFGLRVNSDAPLLTCGEPKPTIVISPVDSNRTLFAAGHNCLGSSYLDPADVIGAVKRRNGCEDAEPLTTESDGGSCDRFDCATAVTWCRANGGGIWPGVPQELELVSMFCDDPESEMDVAGTLIDFFARQR